MKAPINFQTILKDGKPEYVVLPYAQFLRVFRQHLRETSVPHEVVNLMVDKDISRIRAWREYLGLTQQEVAERMHITQAALSQMEAVGTKLQKSTLKKLAKALDLNPEQLH